MKNGATVIFPAKELSHMPNSQKSDQLTVSQFAKLSGLTRTTLSFYDRMGLISPASRGSNNYRYYDSEQLVHINLIRTFQAFGMPIEEIKRMQDTLTPEIAYDLFGLYIKKSEERIEESIRIQKLLLTFQQSIESVSNINEEEITVQFLPARAIALGDINDYSRGRTLFDALSDFYTNMSKKYPNTGTYYAARGVYTQEQAKRGKLTLPDRFYFNNPDGRDRRPAANYAIGYMRGNYGEIGDLHKRLISYIESNDYEICGNAYKEYPLNEICINDKNNYLIRVMITVRKKRAKR